jgi:adenylate cyclase
MVLEAAGGQETGRSPWLYAAVGSVFFLLVVGLIGGIVWYDFEQTSELSLVEGDKLIEEMSDKVIERIQNFYDPLVAIVRLSARMPDLREVMSLNPQGLKLLINGLEAYPQVFNLYLGDDEGGFFMITRAWLAADEEVAKRLGSPKGAYYAVEQIAPGPAPRKAVWTFLERDGSVIEQHPEAATEFDPRTRPWYRVARDSDQTQYIAPYVAAASHQIVVTLSHRTAALPGVFAADISHSDLSVFLTQQRVTPLTQVFLFNREGEVTAHPLGVEIVKTHDDGSPPSLAKLADRGDPVMAALQSRLSKIDPLGGTLRFDAANVPYLARITLVPRRYGTGEFLATIVPVDDILGPIKRIQRRTLFYSLALLVVALPLYVVLVFLLVDRRLGHKIDLLPAADEE